eukprot:5541226-Pleurochrysis_carterae.AAC.2
MSEKHAGQAAQMPAKPRETAAQSSERGDVLTGSSRQPTVATREQPSPLLAKERGSFLIPRKNAAEHQSTQK